MTQNDSKWLKITQNDSKWLKMTQHDSKMTQHDSKWLNVFESFWVMLSHFWVIVSHCESFWVILSHFESFWVVWLKMTQTDSKWLKNDSQMTQKHWLKNIDSKMTQKASVHALRSYAPHNPKTCQIWLGLILPGRTQRLAIECAWGAWMRCDCWRLIEGVRRRGNALECVWRRWKASALFLVT